MDENTPILLDHQQAKGLGENGVKTAGVDGGAAGDDQAHGRAKATDAQGPMEDPVTVFSL